MKLKLALISAGTLLAGAVVFCSYVVIEKLVETYDYERAARYGYRNSSFE